MVETELKKKLFAIHESGRGPSLPRLCEDLLQEQKKAWRELAAGYDELGSVRVRDIPCRGFTVQLQFNPRRIASTGASVDPESVRKRPCFLCLENLPRDQRGILYGGAFLILCNPAPIFHSHFTISGIRHVPQEIAGNVAALLSLARDLSGRFTVFYNGPRCGASAPDHLHFQAVPARSMPVGNIGGKEIREKRAAQLGSVALFQLENIGRTAVVLKGGDAKDMEDALMRFVGEMKKAVPEPKGEPMLNLLCSHGPNGWRITVFPRRKHRPDVFYREGDGQIMVSPAAVDLGGLVVIPRERDFIALGPESVQDIFREVSLDQETLNGILSGFR